MTPERKRYALELMRRKHDESVEINRWVFKDAPPDDGQIYVYTYYSSGYPLYHGFTVNAPRRAQQHRRQAPWSSWADAVRYRRCRNEKSARLLELRLQKKVPSVCHAYGQTRAYYGEDWSDREREFKCNHITGTCKLPGGLCHAPTVLKLAQDLELRILRGEA